MQLYTSVLFMLCYVYDVYIILYIPTFGLCLNRDSLIWQTTPAPSSYRTYCHYYSM